MHCNDNPQAIEVADRKREQGDQGAGGPPRDATEDSVMLPTAALETSLETLPAMKLVGTDTHGLLVPSHPTEQ